MEKCYRIALWASRKKWTNRNVNCNSLLRCQERGKSPWGCCTLTRYLVEVKNVFFFFFLLPWSELSTSGKEKETQISWAKIGNKNANAPLVNAHETGIHVGGEAWVFPAVFMVAGKSSLPLCLGDGWKQGDHAWPALLRRERKWGWAGTRVWRISRPRRYELLQIGVLGITSLSGLALKAVSMGKEDLGNPWSPIPFCPWAGN